MAKPLRRGLVTTLLSALVVFALVPAASAHSTKPKSLRFSGGATYLALDAATAKALTSNGFSVAPVKPASVTPKGRVKFPITYGKVDKATLAGKIRHTGGLSIAKGKTKVKVVNFTIDTKRSRLTARVGGPHGPRVPLLKLNLAKAKVSINKTHVRVANVGASLTPEAAKALNKAFKTQLFKAGLKIGTAEVVARRGH